MPVNLTLPAGPPERGRRRAPARASREGYACFKVKVGLPDDAERVAAVREAIGPLAGAAPRRERRLDASRRRCARSGRSRSTTSSSWSSRADARGAGRGAPRVSGADRGRRVGRARRATCARAAELEACDVVNVKLAGAAASRAAREAIARLARTGWSRSCRARSTGPGGSPPRCSSPPPSGSRWPAGWRRWSSSTPARARAARAARPLAVPAARLGVEWPAALDGGRGWAVRTADSASPGPKSSWSQEVARAAAANASGRSRCAAWPAPRRSPRARAAARGHPARPRCVALVERAGDASSGSSKVSEPVPDRLEHALAGGAEQHRELARVVAQAARALRLEQASRLVANTGWRSQRSTTSLDRRRLHPGGELLVGPARGRALAGVVDARRGADRARAPGSARVAQRRVQREPPAQRVADQQRAPRRPPRSRRGGPRRCARADRGARSDSVRQQLRDRLPGVAALHEARDEHEPRIASRMIPINRTYAPLQAFVDELARCGMRHAVTSPGLAQRAARADAGGAGADRGGLGARRALRGLRGAGDRARRAGGRWR